MSPSFYKSDGNRSILIKATSPTGLKIVQGSNSKSMLVDCSNTEIEKIFDTKNPDSIFIITSPGDDLNDISDVKNFALELNILVTTIIILNECCQSMRNTGSLDKLRSVSNMVVFTSDKNYFAYALECLG